jgi:uncharacterized membrane protein YGL010W
MRSYNEWMSEYAKSHTHPINQLIHKICVPLIMFSLVGLLWSIPFPTPWQILPYLNWATVFISSCLIFYLLLNFKIFLGMLLIILVMFFMTNELHEHQVLLPISLGIFILSWLAQFYGHKIEGKKPSFLEDLAFLLIGPAWVLRFLYKKLGIQV